MPRLYLQNFKNLLPGSLSSPGAQKIAFRTFFLLFPPPALQSPPDGGGVQFAPYASCTSQSTVFKPVRGIFVETKLNYISKFVRAASFRQRLTPAHIDNRFPNLPLLMELRILSSNIFPEPISKNSFLR